MLRIAPRVTVCLLLLCACLTLNTPAQVNNASVTGLVTDTTGAVVPSASVTLRNKATNVETTATTDSSGYYTFASVPGGDYTVTVERQGFKRVVLEGVKLEVGQKARVDAALEVGAVTETVTVTSATLLTTQEATTGGVIENRMVEQLPLSGR
ncbi:MAG TPA: carboxypeptidase-like regulatory domain-containing protein, partial [Pyrinomonadaceae bacterium]